MWTGCGAVSRLAHRCTGPALHHLHCRRSLHVCVVGSGPAGFYTADKLLKSFDDKARVDILDRLPVPFGLVRSGVAPDHPETKIVVNQFSKIASSSQCSFLGNVWVGKDVSLAELRSLYDVVVLAYGAESDNALNIPGENLAGVHSAREFVWWYNAHPDCVNLPVDLQSTESAVVLGQGNVAIDVARVLLRPVEDLRSTDIADHALAALQRSNIKRVYLVGRRGPVQIACTAKELRELLSIKGVRVIIQESDLATSPVDDEELNASRIHKRVYELLSKAARSKSSTALMGQEKELHFVFFRQPKKFVASEDGERVASLQLEKTILQAESGGRHQSAVGTGIYEDLSAGLVLKSIGYKSLPLEGLPLDQQRGVVPNVQGRVLRPETGDQILTVEPGLYVVGWLKRGPTGIIGTNLICAEEVTGCIVEDAKNKLVPMDPSHTGSTGLRELLTERGVHFVSFEDWQKINAFEIAEGSKTGKPRRKLTSLTETLKAAELV